MKKLSTKPAPASNEEQPQSGGAYIRLPDGTLVKESSEPVPEVAPQDNADPAATSAAATAQEA